MKIPDRIVIDGRAYSWRQIAELRRQQLKAWRKAQPQQPVLFALQDDRRPESERSPAGRYQEPGLFTR